MKVKVLEEAGYDHALMGMAYSYKDRETEIIPWWNSKKEKAIKRASLLSDKEGGHNKFLESIVVYIDIEASRAFWGEFDTYRIGITKQSESTMHTLQKREPNIYDFEIDTPLYTIDSFIGIWRIYKDDVSVLKHSLPEGWLQRRVVCTNYKTLKNIISQRVGHRFKWWDVFIKEILNQIQHPELLKGKA